MPPALCAIANHAVMLSDRRNCIEQGCPSLFYYWASWSYVRVGPSRLNFWARSQNCESDCWLRLVCPSICPSSRFNSLPLDGFPLNVIFEYFSKICLEISSLIKIGQEQRVLYVNAYVDYDSISLNSSQSEKCFRQNVVEKIKAHILHSMFLLAVCNITWKNIG
jgi:hypothetical protein